MVEQMKHYLGHTCVEGPPKYIRYGQDALERKAKPVREEDLDYQPTFRMGPLGDAEVTDQKSVQKEEGRSSGSEAASAAGRKAMPDTNIDAETGRDTVTGAPHDQPRTSAEESCHPGSSSQFSTSLPQLTYQFVAVDLQPPTRTGPWVPEGCGNIVRPGVKGMLLPSGNELESLKEKMAKTSEEIKSKLDEREENMKNLKKQVENKTKCIEELQQEVNKLQLEIENMNKQHKEAVDIYQKDIETRKVNENKLHEEVEKMKLLYDEATMIQRETDIRCQHKITEMVALMEKHKNEYDKMVEEKNAELKIYKIRQQKQSSSERALTYVIKTPPTDRLQSGRSTNLLESRAQGKSKKCFSNWIVIQTALSTRTFWSPWPATAISNSSSISHFLLLALPDTRQLQLLHFCFFLSIPLAALLGNSLIISTTACGHHLHTPMFFFLLNLALTHLGSICTTVPKAMYSSLWDTRHISYAGCAAQVSLFFCLMSVEYFLLTIMRFDHYVSICKLLHYRTLLGSRACAHMAAAAWASAFLNALMHTANTFSLPLCQGNALGQFFCEIPHILKFSCSKSYLRELGLIAVTASLMSLLIAGHLHQMTFTGPCQPIPVQPGIPDCFHLNSIKSGAKPVVEGDLDYQPTFKMEGLEDAEAKPVGEGDLDSQPTFKMEVVEDAEVMDQKSVQKEELPGGSSGSVAASAAERKEMADTNTVTDADKARAAKPVGEGDLDSQPTFKMEVVEDAEVMDQKSVQKEELPGGSSGSVAASAAERKEMADTNTVTDADKARAAKPVGEGDLDSQPTFKMEVVEDAEVMDQKSVQKEELPGGSSGSVAASAAERKEMADTNTVTDADKARAAKPVLEGDLDYQPISITEPLEDAEAKPVGEGDLDSQPTFKMEVVEDAEAKPVGEGDLDSQPTFKMEVVEDAEDTIRRMGAEIQIVIYWDS
ncbi:hypothetical protein DUI87_34695 [Hirundo rustica rustica]|uniref:G-protein coupled receptors family 1 profile domain-containing protein n=1 Tax=Hirundo rustica rustica TaxID=333673 RepID=A0A3M0IR44_HIRRU|nr:hypothetical protein DUI87_34695 [Hirundo rustica rustica]